MPRTHSISHPQLLVGRGVGRGLRRSKRVFRKRLVGHQGFLPALEQKFADWPAMKVRHLGCGRGAHADARPELFVGALQPCGDVDGIAMRRVVEEELAAEISDDRGAGIHAYPSDAQRHALSVLTGCEAAGKLVYGESTMHRTLRMVRLLDRCAEHRIDRVTQDLHHRAVVREDGLGQAVEIGVQKPHDAGGIARILRAA